MRTFFFFLLGFGMIACNVTDKKEAPQESSTQASNQQTSTTTGKDSTSFSTIEWIDSTTLNLGTINAGQSVELTWRFRNTGSKPIIIEDVAPTCGCTVASKPEEPIAPGGEGVIKATYNSSGDAGKHVSKFMTLYANITNHNNGSETKLGFTADVKE